jgi:Domain of unknown function (DUF4333)
MSGPQGSDPNQSWQPPGHGTEQSSEQPTQAAGSPWQQQPPQEPAWQTPAYPPPAYPHYQQPAEQPYQQQYPPQTPGYGQSEQFGSAPTQYATPGQYAQPDQYGHQYGQPGQYAQPGQYGQYAQAGQYPQQYQPYEQPGKKRSGALVGGIAAAIGVLVVVAVLVLGFLWPGWFVTTKLDVNKAQAGVQQVLTDETNGYGAKNVKDVKCNGGADPTVKKGGTFDCTVSIDGAQKRVTVTFQDNKGTYEVGRPQ